MKIVSINIEGQRHLKKVGEFLTQEDADIVCLQECFEDRVEELARELYPYRVFAPNCQGGQDERGFVAGIRRWGVAIMAKQPFTKSEIFYADGSVGKTMPIAGGKRGVHLPVVVAVELGEYHIASTHFTWTDGGAITEQQRADFGRLWQWMEKKGELIMVGDFNLPRGSEVYLEMARHYRDNIPTEITSTIDPELHRANKVARGKLALVVDYVWSCLPAGRRQPKYLVSDVRVVSGVSDHCGVIAQISLVE